MADQPKGRVDYSQVRVAVDEETVKVQELTKELDRLIRQTRREYDLWFYGTNDKPPHELRVKLDRHVRLMRSKLPKRTSDAFKIGVVLQKYQSLVELWDKSMRKMEEEGGAVWMASSRTNPLDELTQANENRAENAREAARQAKKKRGDYVARLTGGDDDQALRQVFNSFVEAKKKVGAAVPEGSYKQFAAKLGQQTKALIDSGKASAVAYRVEVADGKVAIKAKAE